VTAVDETVHTRILRPPEQVAAFAMDPANDQRWIGALSSVRTLTDGPFGVGSQVERVASFLGKRLTYVNEITDYQPGRRLSMRSVRAPFPMTVTYDFEPDGPAATRARIRAAGDAGGFYRLAGPLLGRMVRLGVARDLRQLKKRLEERPERPA
jgi:uncharacterized membrane protein